MNDKIAQALPNASVERKIRRIVNKPKTVLFVGAGVSAWSGLPTWNALINALADEVACCGFAPNPILQETDPLIAASLARSILGDTRFFRALNDICEFKGAKPSRLHEVLVSLGATCLITTNYDTLIEQALKAKGEFQKYDVVSSYRQTDCMKISHCNAESFVFKPHGDYRHGDSIVLTKEQYDRLYDGGDLSYLYETLKLLLVSRDVVFIGYGLKDPDFQRILGTVRNLFDTVPNNLYAIIPDSPDEVRSYWGQVNGVQICSYATEPELANPHEPLLRMLESFVPKTTRAKKVPLAVVKAKRITPTQKELLKRYANRIVQELSHFEHSIPLCVKWDFKYAEEIPSSSIQAKTDSSFLLTGAPGGGKTFFLKQYCLKTIHEVSRWCEGQTPKCPKIPVFIDAKECSERVGVLDLVKRVFPEDLPIERWIEEGRFLVLFDSLDENGAWKDSDADWCLKIRRLKNTVVAASRNEGDAYVLGLPKLKLSLIDSGYINQYLEDHGYVALGGPFDRVAESLRVPLIFELFAKGEIALPLHASPFILHRAYFELLDHRFESQFGFSFDFESALKDFAFELYRHNEKVFPIQALESALHQLDSKMLDWLVVAQAFVVPLSNEVASFFHETVLEYLAASKLAELYSEDPSYVKSLWADQKWNRVLTLAAGFLKGESLEAYISSLLDVDDLLAIEACCCASDPECDIAGKMLRHIEETYEEKSINYQFDLTELHFLNIPFSERHVDSLMDIARRENDILGGVAAAAALRASNYVNKEEIIDLLIERWNDSESFNYTTRLCSVLSECITLEDIERIMIQISCKDALVEDLCGFSELAAAFSLDELFSLMRTFEIDRTAQNELIYEICIHRELDESFSCLVELILQGWSGAFFPLYLALRYEDKQNAIPPVDAHLLGALVSALYDPENSKWAIGLVHLLYSRSSGFAQLVRGMLKYSHGLVKLCFYYAIGKNRRKSFLNLFYSMLIYENTLPSSLVGAFDEFDWGSHPDDVEFIICALIQQRRLEDVGTFLDAYFCKRRSRLPMNLVPKLLSALMLHEDDMPEDDFEYFQYRLGWCLSENFYQDDLLDYYHASHANLRTFSIAMFSIGSRASLGHALRLKSRIKSSANSRRLTIVICTVMTSILYQTS